MENVGLRPVLIRCVRAHALAEPVACVEEAVRRPAGISTRADRIGSCRL